MKHNRFATGSSTYKCIDCGKLTRKISDSGAADVELCEHCYNVAELNNSLSDGDITQEEYDAEILKLEK